MEWISVKNELPNECIAVMVWKTNPGKPHWNTYGYGHYENKKWYLEGGTNDFPNVTHWMPLPEKPKD